MGTGRSNVLVYANSRNNQRENNIRKRYTSVIFNDIIITGPKPLNLSGNYMYCHVEH